MKLNRNATATAALLAVTLAVLAPAAVTGVAVAAASRHAVTVHQAEGSKNPRGQTIPFKIID